MNKKISLTKVLEKLRSYNINDGFDCWGDKEKYIKFCNTKHCLVDLLRYCYENDAKITIEKYIDKRCGIKSILFDTDKRLIKIERINDIYISLWSNRMPYYVYDRTYKRFVVKSPGCDRPYPFITISKLLKSLPKDFSAEIKCWLMLNGVI